MLYWITWPLMKMFMRGIFLFLGGFRREGMANVPRRGGVLLCPNHVCDADAPAVAVASPRNAYFMAKSEIFSIPVLGALVKHFRGFPVHRDTADRAALRRAEDLLKAGEAVVIFPEGGGNENATLQPLHPGALLVALRAKVPVVPVAVRNTAQLWTYGDPLPHRSGIPVSVTFGEPIDLSDVWGKKGAVEIATTRLTERLAALLDQPVPTGEPKPHSEAAEAAQAARPRRSRTMENSAHPASPMNPTAKAA